jgi:hypothetical protein
MSVPLIVQDGLDGSPRKYDLRTTERLASALHSAVKTYQIANGSGHRANPYNFEDWPVI